MEEIKLAWADWLKFLQHPTREHYPGVANGEKWRRLGAILVIDIVLSLIALGLISAVSALELVDLEDHAVADMFEELGPLLIFAAAVFLGPAIEELFFRGPIAFGTRPMTPAVEASLTGESPDSVTTESAQKKLRFFAGRFRPEATNAVFLFLFWFLAVAFAYLHITNYTDKTTMLWVVSPLLVLPQFLIGLLAAYMGVRFGWVWAYLLHMIHNALFVGVAIFGMTFFPEDVEDTILEDPIGQDIEWIKPSVTPVYGAEDWYFFDHSIIARRS